MPQAQLSQKKKMTMEQTTIQWPLIGSDLRAIVEVLLEAVFSM
jgi:hypothetical protein